MTAEGERYAKSGLFIGPRIRYFRAKAGISQTELTRRLGIHKSGVGNWESERRPVPWIRLPELADALGITLDRLTYKSGSQLIPDDDDGPPRYREYRLTCMAAGHSTEEVWLEQRGRREILACRFRCAICRSGVFITEGELVMAVADGTQAA